MSRRQASIYRGLHRPAKLTEPDLAPRKLTPEQILELRYQCARERGDLEEAEALKALMTPDKQTDLSTARKQAEQLFRKQR